MKMNKTVIAVTVIALAFGIMFSSAVYAKNMNAPQSAMSGAVNTIPYEALSEDEEAGLIYMREEEKLARDVYYKLFEIWQAPIFDNISQSEQQHMNSIKALLDKYGIADPVVDPTAGVFTNAELQELYFDLVDQGSQSLIDALYVGATIEDLDIRDLEDCIAETDNQDTLTVYQNLMKGSRNHLRAFTYQLSLYGETYEAQFITADELAAIITSPRESGRVDENGDAVVSGKGAKNGGMSKKGNF